VSIHGTLDRPRIAGELVGLLESLTRDWELDPGCRITPESRLMGDIGAESIDIVMLIVAIEEHFEHPGLPFEDLLMVDGRYVEDLTVDEIAGFLHDHLG